MLRGSGPRSLTVGPRRRYRGRAAVFPVVRVLFFIVPLELFRFADPFFVATVRVTSSRVSHCNLAFLSG
jgi:hypothetical protein